MRPADLPPATDYVHGMQQGFWPVPVDVERRVLEQLGAAS